MPPTLPSARRSRDRSVLRYGGAARAPRARACGGTPGVPPEEAHSVTARAREPAGRVPRSSLEGERSRQCARFACCWTCITFSYYCPLGALVNPVRRAYPSICSGEVRERLKRRAWRARIPARGSGVRIPPSPPGILCIGRPEWPWLSAVIDFIGMVHGSAIL